jgi:hypothetical protein
MLATLSDLYERVNKWSNDNQGVVSIAIFAATLLFGWASGIFLCAAAKTKVQDRVARMKAFAKAFPIASRKGSLM